MVGRILEVGMRRWKVDTHSKLDSVLMLSSVNLPGGELVRIFHLAYLPQILEHLNSLPNGTGPEI